MTNQYYVSGLLNEFGYYVLNPNNVLILEDDLIINNATIVNDIFEGVTESGLHLFRCRLIDVEKKEQEHA